MRHKYCVLVTEHNETCAIGAFTNQHSARTYAATLPPATVRGIGRLVTTDMFRVETGHGVPARRQPAEATR